MSTPDFNPAAFEAMAPGEPKRLVRLAAAYERSTRDSLEKLANAIDRHDLGQIRDIGHKLKSGSNWLGAYALGTIGEQLENLPDDPGVAAAPALREAAESCFATLLGKLAEALASIEVPNGDQHASE